MLCFRKNNIDAKTLSSASDAPKQLSSPVRFEIFRRQKRYGWTGTRPLRRFIKRKALIHFKTPDEPPPLVKQLELNPVPPGFLAKELKEIYANYLKHEEKSKEIIGAQLGSKSELSHDQWTALSALQLNVISVGYDFLLALCHPTADAQCRQLEHIREMPARLWRHGILDYLQLLSSRLPGSCPKLIPFAYKAYHALALQHDTLPAFAGDSGLYLSNFSLYLANLDVSDETIFTREEWTEHWKQLGKYWRSRSDRFHEEMSDEDTVCETDDEVDLKGNSYDQLGTEQDVEKPKTSKIDRLRRRIRALGLEFYQ